jgi:hypothetical protein
MAFRGINVKIETIPRYSPVEADDHVSPPIRGTGATAGAIWGMRTERSLVMRSLRGG